MRRNRLAPWVLITSLGLVSVTLSPKARAGCCDDFFSCLATVATAGVSCQVQGLINTVTALHDTVSGLIVDMTTRTADIIADARTAVEQAANEIQASRTASLAALNDAAKEAYGINHPPAQAAVMMPKVAAAGARAVVAQGAPAALPPGATPTLVNPGSTGVMAAPAAPRPADPNALKGALSQAEAYVLELKTKGTALSTDVSSAEQRARAAVVRHVAAAHRIATELAVTPLKMLGESLLDLLSHPERIFDPSAQIEADLQRMSTELPALLDRIGKEVADEATQALTQAQAPAKQLEDQAAVANAILIGMRKAQETKTQADLDSLNQLLPKTAPNKVMALRGVTLPAGVTARHEVLTTAAARLQVAKMPLIAKHRATVVNIAREWERIKAQTKVVAPVDATTKAKVEAQVRQQLQGKSKDQVAKKRADLLAQAKVRFANDPKTLEKVKLYLETHGG